MKYICLICKKGFYPLEKEAVCEDCQASVFGRRKSKAPDGVFYTWSTEVLALENSQG